MTSLPLAVIVAMLACVPSDGRALAQERYVRAEQDDAGRLRIHTADGRAVVIPAAAEQPGVSGQTGVSRIAISPDGRAVGWTPMFGFCCTSYPIPLALHVYTDGRTFTFAGNGTPVSKWAFVGGGAEVVFAQETLHGGLGINYEWRDITTNRQIAQWRPAYGPDDHPLPEQKPPAWVVALDRQQ